MAAITVQHPGLTGLQPTMAAAVGPDTFTNTGVERLYVSNGDGTATTVTIDSKRPCDQGFDHNVAVSVPAAAVKFEIGPFDPQQFSATVTVTYSKTTSLTVAVVG